MPVRGKFRHGDALALPELRQTTLFVIGLATAEFVNGLHVGGQEAGEGNGTTACGEHHLLAGGSGTG
ncbi:Uncharacterised protein [Mycobacteroides abscessus subsp. abscessus]|nr:Uncharacterised protein [Mycobacteroides abscessus subsp. abscessus]